MSTLDYTKVLTLGEHEKYWGGAWRIHGLCTPYNFTYFQFPGNHCQEEHYKWVVGKAMAELLG